MRLWALTLALAFALTTAPVAGCAGTEGTLVVRRSDAEIGAGGAAAAENPWVPPPDVAWYVRLDGAVDTGLSTDLFYLDAELQDPAELQALRAEGRRYFCYLSAGSVESFRDDAGEFPPEAVGNTLVGYRNERWLDVRSPGVRQLMARRVERLAALGCDGVPPSSLAVHAADTGFELSALDALDYARWLAERIHAAGMSAGLAGPAELTEELWPTFDFGLAVDCLERTECAEFQVFVAARKPVLHVELGDAAAAPELCKAAEPLGFQTLVSTPGFDGNVVPCRGIL